MEWEKVKIIKILIKHKHWFIQKKFFKKEISFSESKQNFIITKYCFAIFFISDIFKMIPFNLLIGRNV